MRTDVKVGLICAFAVVLCVVIYFVARGNKGPATPAKDPAAVTQTDATGSGTPVSGTTGVGGGVIGVPAASAPVAMTPSLTTPGTPVAGTGSTGAAATAGPTAGAPLSTPVVPGMTTGTPAGIETPGGFGSPIATGTGTGTPATFGPGTVAVGTTGGPASIGTPTPVMPPAWDALRPTMEMGTPTLATPAGATTYKIQKGDMLGPIARKFGVSVQAIKQANPGIDENRLKIDTVIKIPAASVAAASSGTPASVPAAPTTGTPSARTSERTTAAASSATIKPGSTYKIKKGDTLTTIAKAAYGTTDGWQRIFRANRGELHDPDVVPVGAEIVIPQ